MTEKLGWKNCWLKFFFCSEIFRLKWLHLPIWTGWSSATTMPICWRKQMWRNHSAQWVFFIFYGIFLVMNFLHDDQSFYHQDLWKIMIILFATLKTQIPMPKSQKKKLLEHIYWPEYLFRIDFRSATTWPIWVHSVTVAWSTVRHWLLYQLISLDSLSFTRRKALR